jgi:hypothetical protein
MKQNPTFVHDVVDGRDLKSVQQRVTSVEYKNKMLSDAGRMEFESANANANSIRAYVLPYAHVHIYNRISLFQLLFR